ncbi:MAG: DUF4340 domain-containing protein [Bdellovibrionales bacterium]|nr:DUF4340 domain-containing protein [Bdellovibrionales bacterium]
MKAKFFFQIISSVLILTLGAFALYKYQKTLNQKEKESLLFPQIKLEDLKALRLFKTKEEFVSIVRKGESWFLLKPLKDLASLTELSRWFDEVSRQRVKELEEDVNWQTYSFKKYPFVELDLKSGETLSFSVSSKRSFDDRWFVKKGNQLFIAESSLANEINNKNLEDFRSKKILPSLNHVTRIEFKGIENFVVDWKNQSWFLEKRNLPLNQDLLDDFWNDLSSLKADSIADTVQKQDQLDKVFLTLKLFYGEKEFLLKMSPIKDTKVYISISHRDYIFEVSKDKLNKILVSKKDIYDYSFPFNYDVSLANFIEIKTKQEKIKIQKEKGKWNLLEGSNQDLKNQVESKDKKSSENLDSDKKEDFNSKIDDFLNQIKQLKVKDYQNVKDSKVLRSVVIKDAKNKLLFKLEELDQIKNISFLKTNLWKEGFALSKEETDKIFHFFN